MTTTTDILPTMQTTSLELLKPDMLRTRVYYLGNDVNNEYATELWPLKSYKKCMHCHHYFSTVPFPIVVHANEDDSYECMGNFCSCECALGWIQENPSFKGLGTYNTIHFAKKLAPAVYSSCGIIRPAPRPELYLIDYGGMYDIAQYRTKFCHGNPLETCVRFFPPNCTHQPFRWIEAYRASPPSPPPLCVLTSYISSDAGFNSVPLEQWNQTRQLVMQTVANHAAQTYGSSMHRYWLHDLDNVRVDVGQDPSVQQHVENVLGGGCFTRPICRMLEQVMPLPSQEDLVVVSNINHPDEVAEFSKYRPILVLVGDGADIIQEFEQHLDQKNVRHIIRLIQHPTQPIDQSAIAQVLDMEIRPFTTKK